MQRDKLSVCQQRDGSIEVAGLTVETVAEPEEVQHSLPLACVRLRDAHARVCVCAQVYAYLARAASHRATAKTLKNDRRCVAQFGIARRCAVV
jgi:hypothetical protein